MRAKVVQRRQRSALIQRHRKALQYVSRAALDSTETAPHASNVLKATNVRMVETKRSAQILTLAPVAWRASRAVLGSTHSTLRAHHASQATSAAMEQLTEENNALLTNTRTAPAVLFVSLSPLGITASAHRRCYHVQQAASAEGKQHLPYRAPPDATRPQKVQTTAFFVPLKRTRVLVLPVATSARHLVWTAPTAFSNFDRVSGMIWNHLLHEGV